MSVFWEKVLLAIVMAERNEDSEILLYSRWDKEDTYCAYLKEQLAIRPGSTRYTSPAEC